MYKKYVSRIVPCFMGRNKLGLFATDVGYIEPKSNYECKMRVLSDYYLITVLSGKGSFVSKDNHFDVSAGDMCFLFPNVLHAYKTDSKMLLNHIWIGFNGMNAGMLLENIGIDENNPVVKCGTQSKAFNKVIEIYNLMETTEYSSTLKAVAGLYDIFADLSKDNVMPLNAQKRFSNPVQHAIGFMENNYTNLISIAMIAEFSGLSRSYFSTLFIKEVGVTPLNFLKELRMNQAEYYLKNTNLSIQDIAHSVGYDNGLYFSKDFSKRYGVCPSEYIMRYKRNNLK